MNEIEYYDLIRAIGLRATRFPETFVTVNGQPFNVPLGRDLTPEQREMIIGRLRRWLADTA